ncbi:MAG: ketoacyl-ACP synthase III [Myxococcales bacterium]|nr:ketoacyl-ACP synthase III [Myxococcales bacterium]
MPNAEIERIVETTDEWIESRTGIRRRHIAAEGETTSDLAAEAGRRALQAAGLNVADLDLIIVGTVTPDSPIPSCAVLVQKKLGASEIPAFDIAAACAGFVYGLTIADQFIATGAARSVLVIGVELLSRAVNWTDRTTCVLFGDGAGAVVLGPSSMSKSDEPPRSSPPGILSTCIFTDGSLAGALNIPAGGSAHPPDEEVLRTRQNKVHMNGQDVFRTAVKQLTASSTHALKASGLTSRELDWVVPHQANMRIISQVSHRLGFPLTKMVLNLEEYGNTSSASIPIALDEAVRDGRIQPGQHVLMCALGAGISWGAAVVRM